MDGPFPARAKSPGDQAVAQPTTVSALAQRGASGVLLPVGLGEAQSHVSGGPPAFVAGISGGRTGLLTRVVASGRPSGGAPTPSQYTHQGLGCGLEEHPPSAPVLRSASRRGTRLFRAHIPAMTKDHTPGISKRCGSVHGTRCPSPGADLGAGAGGRCPSSPQPGPQGCVLRCAGAPARRPVRREPRTVKRSVGPALMAARNVGGPPDSPWLA
ncbi:hypothetical protein H4W33_006006 [Kibdelosporangium phytohabitans]|nr:hypothetical protein [Kibdelosporangium phytohabitans]